MRRGIPVPLKEFNEAVTRMQVYQRINHKRIISRADAERELRSQLNGREVEGDSKQSIRETVKPEKAARRIDIKEAKGNLEKSWEKLGLSPEAAKIAADTERETFQPKDMSNEDWASLLDKASGRTR